VSIYFYPKYERFFRTESVVVATLYAPIILPSVSVLVFREKKDGTQALVATGSLLSANPDRVTVKRAVLSGAPFKVHKKSAVVRFMFFNREDIDWFKPVELRTKYGRRGHIRGDFINIKNESCYNIMMLYLL